MYIPENQLITWAKQGSVQQSASTYQTIKSALESPTAAYAARDFKVFLNGSYGNQTNIYAESDVDITILYAGAYFSDLRSLSPAEQFAHEAQLVSGTYFYETFRSEVGAALVKAFGADVTPGNKVFNVAANGTRRSADVLVAFEFRRFYRFNSAYDERHETGVCFFRRDGARVANFPKQHAENITVKHQSTNSAFKPVVRIFKNLRSKLEEDQMIGANSAPSYLIECLLHSVPNDKFTGNFSQMMPDILNWLHESDRSAFETASRQFMLLQDNPVGCKSEQCEAFIDAAIRCWNEWP